MATALPVLLFFSGILCSTAMERDCDGYFTISGIYRTSQDCPLLKFCCGTCDDRYCCSDPFKMLDDDFCVNKSIGSIAVGSIIAAVVIIIALFVICCVCPCCCLYKMCRTPRPVMTTTTHTTVISSQYPQQQPLNPGQQYPAYQQVTPQSGYGVQPGYGGQPMPAAPYQGQPYAPGPPPPYHESAQTPSEIICRHKSILKALPKAKTMTRTFQKHTIDRNTMVSTSAIAELAIAAPEVYEEALAKRPNGEMVLPFTKQCEAAIQRDEEIKDKIESTKAGGTLLPIRRSKPV